MGIWNTGREKTRCLKGQLLKSTKSSKTKEPEELGKGGPGRG